MTISHKRLDDVRRALAHIERIMDIATAGLNKAVDPTGEELTRTLGAIVEQAQGAYQFLDRSYGDEAEGDDAEAEALAPIDYRKLRWAESVEDEEEHERERE